MKICQILASTGDGGLEKHTIELSQGLRSKGVDVTVIANKSFKDDFKNIRFIELDLSKSRFNIFLLWKLYKILKKENFDIVHTQANKATDIVVKLKPFINSKIIATLHNFKKNLKPFLKTDCVITVSDRIGENLRHKQKYTVYNGLDIKEKSSINLHKEFDIPNDKFIICSVGRIVEAKGFDMLIESMQHTDQDIYLLLIGEGPDKEKIELLSKNLNVDNRIKFLGNIENKFTKSIINSSDLLVISSRREGFSYVFAESLLLNTSIVSTDVADIKKFITSRNIAPFDPKLFANKVNEFKNNYEQNLIEYQDIFKKAQTTFTLENMVKETIDVYKKII